MYTSTTSVFSVNKQARTLCPQKASKEKNRFITGTCSLHEENELFIIEYREESNQIDAVATFEDIESPESSYTFNDEPLLLESLVKFEDIDNSIQSVTWNKSGQNVILTSTTSSSLWSITESSAKKTARLSAEDGLDINADYNWCYGVSAFDPHSSNQYASSFSNSLHIIDTKQLNVSMTISNAHSSTIRDIDYNPNKPLTLITASEDRTVKFWDLRHTKEPVKTLQGHYHWVWSAKYNPFHDQLLASTGCDSLVNLWRIATCSSAPWLENDKNDNEEQGNDPPDVKVRTIDQHEDSVYGIAWSPSDAWIYATLSFDGRIVLNHVPSTEKYKILL
eukprot:gene19304-25165_t